MTSGWISSDPVYFLSRLSSGLRTLFSAGCEPLVICSVVPCYAGLSSLPICTLPKNLIGKNTCPKGTTCRSFDQVYRNASQFCHAVWDGAWMATDSSLCLHFLGNKVPSLLRHNHHVATFQANNILRRLGNSHPCVGTKLLVLFSSVGLILLRVILE